MAHQRSADSMEKLGMVVDAYFILVDPRNSDKRLKSGFVAETSFDQRFPTVLVSEKRFYLRSTNEERSDVEPVEERKEVVQQDIVVAKQKVESAIRRRLGRRILINRGRKVYNVAGC